MKFLKYVFVLLIISTLLSCNSNHYEKEFSFPSGNWIKFNELEMLIPMEADNNYDFFGIIKTDSSFERRKIEMGFYLTLPSGEERFIDQTYRILDYEYQPLGTWKGSAFENNITFRENIFSDETGLAKLSIVLHSQYYNNPGISGLTITVKEK